MIATKEIKGYSIDQHPNKEAVFSYIRENWHDLGEHYIDDLVVSLKALADEIGGKLDYSVSLFPDRGEFIRLTDFNRAALNKLKAIDYPLTGCFYDYVVIEGLKADELEYRALKALHDEGEWLYSDEGLTDMCEANQWLFTEEGEIF